LGRVCGQVRITHHQCRKAILDEILITPPVVGFLSAAPPWSFAVFTGLSIENAMLT